MGKVSQRMLLGRILRAATGEEGKKQQGSREPRRQEAKSPSQSKEDLRVDVGGDQLQARNGLNHLSKPVIFSLMVSLLDSTY